MKANAPRAVLFTVAGGLYIGSPVLEAFHLIPYAPENPPSAVSGISTSTDTGLAYDAVGDMLIDTRPKIIIVAPST